jgi:hypothetical protein
MSILNELGIDEATYEEATGASVSEGFQPLESGAYKATVKEIFVYQNSYGTNSMHYVFNLTESGKDIKFRGYDTSDKLKDGTANIGYSSRLKSVAFAAGVELDKLSTKPGTIKLFGKDQDGKFIIGMNDKPLVALVRLSDDTSKADGEPYKLSNDIEGVCDMKGFDASGKNAVEAFNEKVAKTPVFGFKGKSKQADSSAGAGQAMSPDAAAKAASLI